MEGRSIRNLSKKHTVILSSHIPAEVREVCDYILLISKGKLVANDTPAKLERLMNGSESVEIESKLHSDTVREILRSVAGIDEVKIEKTEDETTYAKIEVEAGRDIREAVFLAFAEKKVPLLTLKTAKVSLEEVFMELTQGDEAEAYGLDEKARMTVKATYTEGDMEQELILYIGSESGDGNQYVMINDSRIV